MLIQILLIQVATFVLLIIVLRFLFYRQLNSALSRLKLLHEENLKKEAELNSELDAIKKQRERELAQAREEAVKLLKEARVKSERMAGEIQSAAQAQAQSVMEQSRVKAQVLEQELVAGQYAKALDLAEKIVSMAFTATGAENIQQLLFSELIEEIRSIDPARFTVKSPEAKIFSAYPLREEQKRVLSAILSEKMGLAVQMEECISADIIAGLRAQIGALTLDGSLKNKFEKILSYLKAQQAGVV
jgi:F-type H+-transporting ATPase subunit b